MTDLLLTVTEVAELLGGVSENQVRRLTTNGHIPVMLVNGQPRYSREALYRWIDDLSAGRTVEYEPINLRELDPNPKPVPQPTQRTDGRWTVRVMCPDGVERRFVTRKGEPVQAEHVQVQERTRQNMPARLRFAVLERDGFRCAYCGATSKDAELVVDHVVPLAAGGSSELDNLITACFPCNAGKGKRRLRAVTA